MKTVDIAGLGADFLRLIEEARQTGEPIELFEDGEPVATVQLRPAANGASYEPGQFKDEIRIVGDLDDLGVEWEALR